jgi:hypothetical protein
VTIDRIRSPAHMGVNSTVALSLALGVAQRLGYTNPSKAMSDHCKGITKRYPLQTAGGVQEFRVLDQPDGTIGRRMRPRLMRRSSARSAARHVSRITGTQDGIGW